MTRLLTILALASLAALGMVPSAAATVPSTMSYQGVLTDNSGNLVPNGLYNLVFKVFDAGAGGNLLWTETQNNVQVSKGGFNVILGSITPLTGVAFDKQLYLEIVVNGNTLAPRVIIASSASALGLRLPFAGSESSAGTVFSIRNAGTGPAIVADPLLQVGVPGASDGDLRLYGPGGSSPIGRLYDYGGYGAAIEGYDASGFPTNVLEPDVNGSGGFLAVWGTNNYSNFFMVDGNSDGAGNPVVYISGAASQTVFNTAATGDASVQLPPNAISAAEILDEPGIAQNHLSGAVSLANTANFTNILAVTINIPAPGYVVLMADAQMQLFSTGLSGEIQITDVSGALEDGNHYFGVGGASVSSGTITQNWVPAAIHRTYYEGAAGSYTFYFQGRTNSGAGTVGAWNPTLTAFYTPTSYGTVTTAPPLAALGRFERIDTTAGSSNGSGSGVSPGQTVDLRDLELRATRATADAQAAQLRLMRARLEQQKAAGMRGAKPGSR